MEKLTAKTSYKTSKLVCLPFINAPASNYSTIYTTLLEAVKRSKLCGQNHTIITFDQPLYYKAKDIIAACKDETFSNVFIRLGGFHLLLSFLGSVGFLMKGSGLQDLLSEVYAMKSTEKILEGHAYSRAVRAHSLVHCSLTKLIFEEINFTDQEKKIVQEISNSNLPSMLDNLETMLLEIKDKFKNKLKELRNRGPTAALWIQHYELLSLVKPT